MSSAHPDSSGSQRAPAIWEEEVARECPGWSLHRLRLWLCRRLVRSVDLIGSIDSERSETSTWRWPDCWRSLHHSYRIRRVAVTNNWADKWLNSHGNDYCDSYDSCSYFRGSLSVSNSPNLNRSVGSICNHAWAVLRCTNRPKLVSPCNEVSPHSSCIPRKQRPRRSANSISCLISADTDRYSAMMMNAGSQLPSTPPSSLCHLLASRADNRLQRI